jgi:hypothetical protein
MFQGFSIPMSKYPKLCLKAHTKAILHSLTLLGLAGVAGHFTLSENMANYSQWLLASGAWLSLVGDQWASYTGVHMPIATKDQPGGKLDPSEADYMLPAEKRSKPTSSTPAPATAIMKLSAVAMLAGAGIMLSGAAVFRRYY